MNKPSSGPGGCFKVLLSLVTFILLLVILVIGGELYYRHYYADVADDLLNWGDNTQEFFIFDPILGWRGEPNADGHHQSGCHVTHNSRGFRGTEWKLDPDKPHVLILGDSNMWGYGVEDNEVSGYLLNQMEPDIEWINAGMNGYSSDQHLLLYEKLAPEVKPDLTVLVFAGNDRYENRHRRVRGYDKPYSQMENGEPVVQNIPLEEPEKANNPLFIPRSVQVLQNSGSFLLFHLAEQAGSWQRKVAEDSSERVMDITVDQPIDPTPHIIQKLYNKTGGKLQVIMIDHDKHLDRFCRENNIPITTMAPDCTLPGPLSYPKGPPKHGHWKPEGFRRAAEEIHKTVMPRLP